MRAFFNYKRASQIDPNDLENRNYMGLFYATFNLNEKSLKEFDFILSVDPEDGDALSKRAQIYALMGNNEAAAADYERLLNKYPENPHVLYQLAAQENMAGHQKEALKNYIKARKYARGDDFIKAIDRSIASVKREMNQ